MFASLYLGLLPCAMEFIGYRPVVAPIGHSETCTYLGNAVDKCQKSFFLFLFFFSKLAIIIHIDRVLLPIHTAIHSHATSHHG